MTKSAASPDIGQLQAEKLPQSRFPGGGQDFRVHFDQEVHAAIARHAAEDTSVEICGVLVGLWQRDADGPFVAVSQSIRCDAAKSRSGEVTFTHEAWNAINHQMDTAYTDLKIVGWYHSHPNFGIFLSDRDRFIQQHFFSGPGQVAYVVDPVGKTEGVFAWRGGKTGLCPYYWVGAAIRVAPPAGAEAETGREPRPEESPAASPAARGRPAPISWSATLTSVALYVLLFLLGYLLAAQRSAWEHDMLVEGVVNHYGLWKGLRPGLEDDLAKAGEDLQKITQAAAGLAQEHIKLAGDDEAQKKEQWGQVLAALLQTQQSLAQIKRCYGLSAEERAVVEKLLLAKEEALHGVAEKPQAPAKGSGPRKPAAPKPSAETKKSAAETKKSVKPPAARTSSP